MVAIGARRSREQCQSRNRVYCRSHWNAGSSPGGVAKWKRRVFRRHARFYRYDVDLVPQFDALSCLATDAGEGVFAIVRSFGDLPADRRNLHTICARSAARARRLGRAWADLVRRDLRRPSKSDPRRCAAPQTGDVALSRNGLADPAYESSADAGDSFLCAQLAFGGRRRLYRRRLLFHQSATPVFTFHLASVRPRRHGLSFCGCAFVRELTLRSRTSVATIEQTAARR